MDPEEDEPGAPGGGRDVPVLVTVPPVLLALPTVLVAVPPVLLR